jgi:hypothetical protein
MIEVGLPLIPDGPDQLLLSDGARPATYMFLMEPKQPPIPDGARLLPFPYVGRPASLSDWARPAKCS